MRIAGLLIAVFLLLAAPARASQCQATVDGLADVRVVALDTATDAGPRVVRITYIAHSAFRIESPGGIVIVTDFFGVHGADRLPDMVTMNKGHITHYTPQPDPGIAHVLRGWNPGGGPAIHDLVVGDALIRNIPTDLRGYPAPEPDGNSIFVFEIADLCIAHLGHLHHPLSEGHLAALGRMDIVMAPVDGAVTLSNAEVVALMQRLRARIVLPMHAFGPGSLQRFLAAMARDFDIRVASEPSLTVSASALPARGQVLVLPPQRLDPTSFD